MLLSPNEFTSLLNQWFTHKTQPNTLPPLEALGFLKGGWEGWTQTDLAAYIITSDSSDSRYDVLREAPIYGDGRRADLVFNATQVSPLILPPGVQAGDVIVVELKCESFGQTMNDTVRAKFVNGIKDDIEKLQSLTITTHKLMIVMSFSQPLLDFLEVNEFTMIPASNNEMACSIKLI